MPLYEYKCDDCGAVFNMTQSIMDDPHGRCILCQGRNLKRLISAGTKFKLKGDGWYETDYKGKK